MDNQTITTINQKNEVYELAGILQSDGWSLTDYEALKLSIAFIDMQQNSNRNSLLRQAFAISPTDSYPSAIEAIAIQLGYKHTNLKSK